MLPNYSYYIQKILHSSGKIKAILFLPFVNTSSGPSRKIVVILVGIIMEKSINNVKINASMKKTIRR